MNKRWCLDALASCTCSDQFDKQGAWVDIAGRCFSLHSSPLARSPQSASHRLSEPHVLCVTSFSSISGPQMSCKIPLITRLCVMLGERRIMRTPARSLMSWSISWVVVYARPSEERTISFSFKLLSVFAREVNLACTCSSFSSQWSLSFLSIKPSARFAHAL
jgi:hypothetical protein